MTLFIDFLFFVHVLSCVIRMKNYVYLKDVLAVIQEPDSVKIQKTGILIDKDEGLIEKIGELPANLTSSGVEILDYYRDFLVMPGFIDPHVHFRIPGKPESEDWFTGSLAALSGGVTTVLDMPNNNPATTSENGINTKLDHIRQHSLINYGLFGGLTSNNLDFLLNNKDVKAIKVYMASTTGDLLMNQIDNIDFSNTKKVITFHAEDESTIRQNELQTGKIRDPWQHSQIRSEEAAIKAVRQVMDIYGKTRGNFHIAHVSTSREVRELENSGISFECAPHHVFCSCDDYNNGGFLWKCNPPLREAATRDDLLEMLFAGRISMIATDHAPHLLKDKQPVDGIPASGMPGLEAGTHFILNEMVSGKIGILQAAQMLSTNAAKRFGIENRGFIREGFFADLAIVDTRKNWTFQADNVHSKCGWSPYTGFSFQAKVAATFVNGLEYKTSELKKIKLAEKQVKIYQV